MDRSTGLKKPEKKGGTTHGHREVIRDRHVEKFEIWVEPDGARAVIVKTKVSPDQRAAILRHYDKKKTVKFGA
jgi:hypothetical protein